MKVWLCEAGCKWEGVFSTTIVRERKTAKLWLERVFDLQKAKAERFRENGDPEEWPDPEWSEDGLSFTMWSDYWSAREVEVLEPHEALVNEHGQLVKR